MQGKQQIVILNKLFFLPPKKKKMYFNESLQTKELNFKQLINLCNKFINYKSVIYKSLKLLISFIQNLSERTIIKGLFNFIYKLLTDFDNILKRLPSKKKIQESKKMVFCIKDSLDINY